MSIFFWFFFEISNWLPQKKQEVKMPLEGNVIMKSDKYRLYREIKIHC